MSYTTWPGREEIVARAARRRWMVLVGVACAAIVGAVVGGFFGAHHPRRHAHHHSSAVVLWVVLGLWLVLVVVLLAVLLRRGRNPGSRFAPQITWGLRRPDRKQVIRDLKQASPNADPTLQHVEIEVAHRTVQQRRFALAFFGLMVVLELCEAAVHWGSLTGWLFAGAAVLFALGIVYTFWFAKRAQRYLLSLDNVADRQSP